MLDVSADYLLGLTDTPSRIDTSTTRVESEALSLFRELNEEGQDAAIAMLTGLAQRDVYKKGDKDGTIPEEA